MYPIVTEAGFQVAAAAAAAAAAVASFCGGEQISNDAHVSDHYINNETICDADPSCPSTMRSLADANEYPKYGWVDITDDFLSACGELNLGELAQDVSFGLFEAMSAIEMMDPKMDVGMGYNINEPPPHTFYSAAKAGVLKLEKLTPEELIGIFDALFTCLVSWLEGNSIDQVLFTCLYLHMPSKIVDKSLRSFCHAVRHLIVHIKNIIITSSVNEEEDFQLYGNSPLMTTDEKAPSANAIPCFLKDAESDLMCQSRNTPHPEMILAVVYRLRFMRHLYEFLYQIDMAMSTVVTEYNINEIYKHLNASLEVIPQLKRTIEKGTQPLANSDAPNPMGFSPRIHDRSQPPTFPRTVKMRNRCSSLQFLEELVQRLKLTCRIIRLRDYYSVLNFFINFSRKSGQCILSRSVLQGLFISNKRLIFGSIEFKDFLWDSVRTFSNPPIMNTRNTLSSNRNIVLMLDNFFCYCTNAFTQFIRICGYNRARQRDKLARFIETLDTIQVEAARMDSQITLMINERFNDFTPSSSVNALASLNHSAHFATWVLYNCFRAMLLYIMSGFELELYSVHEFLYIYWYPYELLIGFIVSALTRTEDSLLIHGEYTVDSKVQCNESIMEHLNGGTAGYSAVSSSLGVAGLLKARSKNKAKKQKKSQKPYRQEIVYYHAMLSMCGGYYKGLGALTKDGRIKQPMPKFDNEAIRFHKRFMPFAHLTSPPPVSYEEFKSLRDHMMAPPSSEIYAVAAKHFHQARNALESIQNPEQEVLDMLYVAKINYVVMNVLAKGHQRDLKRQPEFDFSRHRHFPIIKLT